MSKAEIDGKYPEHTYNSCGGDEQCNNAGFNQCPRCTELELLRLQNMAIGASILAQEARRHAAVECYEIAMGYLKTCTGQAVAGAIKDRFKLEI